MPPWRTSRPARATTATAPGRSLWCGRTTTAAWRNLTLFDGFDFVQVSGGQELVVGPLQFSGFQTPSSGPVDAHVTSWTYEGDRGISATTCRSAQHANSCTSLTYKRVRRSQSGRRTSSTAASRARARMSRPSTELSNQLGFDLDAPSIPEGTIPNRATGAAVCSGTTGDTYFFGGLAFDTLIRAPNLRHRKDRRQPTASPGDLVTYRVTSRTRNEAPARRRQMPRRIVTIADPTPSGLDFVEFVGNPATPPAGSYDQPGLRVDCKVGHSRRTARSRTATAPDRRRSAGPDARHPRTSACYTSNSQDQPDTIFTAARGSASSCRLPPVPRSSTSA